MLENLDLHTRARVVNAITKAIEVSFSEDKASQTDAEIKRRFDICFKAYKILRNDLGWSLQRVEDEMPVALRSLLDGGSWEPTKRRDAWVTDGKTGLIVPPSVK